MDIDIDDILKSVEEQIVVDKSMFLTEEESKELQSQVDSQADDYISHLLEEDKKVTKGPGVIKILLVDDSKISRKSLKAMVKGYKVVTHDASTGYEAIEAVKTIKDFDLVTMDYNMPGINGMETFERIKEHNVPVVMVTTESSKTMVCEALKQGLAHFILKPVRKDDFLKKITSVLKRNSKQLTEGEL